MPRYKELSKKGFTLMEMLIVVAIIAILIAIAIPVFNTQLEKTRDATDAANERSAKALAVTAYLSDADSDGNTLSYNDGVASYYFDAENGTLVTTKPETPYGKSTSDPDNTESVLSVEIYEDGTTNVSWASDTLNVPTGLEKFSSGLEKNPVTKQESAIDTVRALFDVMNPENEGKESWETRVSANQVETPFTGTKDSVIDTSYYWKPLAVKNESNSISSSKDIIYAADTKGAAGTNPVSSVVFYDGEYYEHRYYPDATNDETAYRVDTVYINDQEYFDAGSLYDEPQEDTESGLYSGNQWVKFTPTFS